ncbi:Nicotinamide/nicotinic acid mononucleotide adenylyltransferase 1 [Knufia fluminis]|uniref:Nicotinamide-nucleotide adenylyltransferase n=2 Tax=Knufia TaxID=430999 RepID=A0AAN8IBE3_9EURO|nr:Nicotinamide/nicotinic acid mononucleotide adenylyltransferase 1 [Knufia fluminis]
MRHLPLANIEFPLESFGLFRNYHLRTTTTKFAVPRPSPPTYRIRPYCRSTRVVAQYSLRSNIGRIDQPDHWRKTSAPLTHRRGTKLQALLGEGGLSEMDNYVFPDYRLKRKMDDPSKTPLLLIACGSFSPITFLHLRMFIMAGDYVKHNTNFEVIGGYLSPVSDAYKKQGLAAAEHRVNMCKLAIDKASNWLMVDTWEAESPEYQPTALVLDHFDQEVNIKRKGIEAGDGERKPVQIALLAGADLIQTMSQPGVWAEKDLDHILGKFGTFIVERSGTDIDEALASLTNYRDNIYVIQQLIQNDVSSTKIRLFLKRGMSVQYLIPAPVVEYIEQNKLFAEENRSSNTNLPATNTEKGKGSETTASASTN